MQRKPFAPPTMSHHRAKRPPRSAGKVPSFVYRQEVFELSIVASSIAHAHEEADRRLTISHKHTTWAKSDARDAQQRAIRQPSSQAGNEKATRSSPRQQKKALRSSRSPQNRKPSGRNSNNSTRTTISRTTNTAWLLLATDSFQTDDFAFNAATLLARSRSKEPKCPRAQQQTQQPRKARS